MLGHKMWFSSRLAWVPSASSLKSCFCECGSLQNHWAVLNRFEVTGKMSHFCLTWKLVQVSVSVTGLGKWPLSLGKFGNLAVNVYEPCSEITFVCVWWGAGQAISDSRMQVPFLITVSICFQGGCSSPGPVQLNLVLHPQVLWSRWNHHALDSGKRAKPASQQSARCEWSCWSLVCQVMSSGLGRVSELLEFHWKTVWVFED